MKTPGQFCVEINIQHLRVRLDTRKWIASRVYRQLYGDKVEISTQVQVDLSAAMEAAEKRLQAQRNRVIDV